MNRRTPSLAACTLVLALPPLSLHAAENSGLEEVVVTAEKSTEKLSKVPISIAAISGEALQEQNIVSYADLSRAVPDLSFTSFGGPGQANIEIRGVASQAGSSTTGIYLDEVPINVLNIYTTGASEPRFFDIDRVEVLRGPQGTIWGAGSMGGTIHFVSNAPNVHDFSGNAHAQIGGTQGGGIDYEGDGVVNLPLMDGKAALRVGALYDRESGWIDRAPNGGPVVAHNINEVKTAVARLTFKYQPTENLTITPALFLQRVSTGGQDLFGLDLPRFQSPTLVAETGLDRYAVTSLTVDYDFGPASLTSVSGYFWRRDDRMIDGTFYDSGFIGEGILQPMFGYGGDVIAGLAAPTQFNTNVNQFHQELRLASHADRASRFSWLLGLFYQRTRTGLLDNEYIPGFNATFQSLYHDTPLDVLGAAFPNDLVYFAFTEFVNSQTALFGQASWAVTPAFKLTAGARYEKAREKLGFGSAGFFSGGGPYAGSADGSATTPKFTASYELSPAALVYATAAKGFRDGGVNRPVPMPLCAADLAGLGLSEAPPSYSSDHLWSYELGGKGRLAENGLSWSGALFDVRWNNIQTDILLPTCTFDIKDNIGSAEIRGVEAELTQKLGPHFTVSLGGNYTDAKITDPVALLGVQKNDRVPGVPEYSLSTAIEYAAPVATNLKGFGHIDAQWIGPSQGVIFHTDPDFHRPSYAVMNGSLGLRGAPYEVSLFVTNLLNQRKIIQRPNIAAVEYGVTVRPRTIGIGGTFHF